MSLAKKLGEKYVGSVIKPIFTPEKDPLLIKKFIIALLQTKDIVALYREGAFNLTAILNEPCSNQALEAKRLQLLELYPNPCGKLKGYIFKGRLEKEENIYSEEKTAICFNINDEFYKLKSSSLTKDGKSYWIYGKIIIPKVENKDILFEDADATIFIRKEDYPTFAKQIAMKVSSPNDEVEFLICATNHTLNKDNGKYTINAVDVIVYTQL